MGWLSRLFGGKEEKPFNPKVFNDPVAERVSWAPLHHGGANFQTRYLKVIDEEEVRFQATTFAYLFGGIFVVFGFGFSIMSGSFSELSNFSKINIEKLFPALFSLIFSGVGVVMIYRSSAPIVFDKRSGYFWKGRKSPSQVARIDQIKIYASLKSIHAIQLISERVKGNKSSYTSYEINLVMNDAGRINVVDHGSESGVRKDARSLADFLDVPVWDAI